MSRVLMVDDHEVVRRGLRHIFEEECPQLELGEAASLARALQMLSAQEWDLVILDLSVSGRNGVDALTEIKEASPRTPVLVFSFFPEEGFAIRSFKLGASGYVHKRTMSTEIVVAVKRVLQGGKYISARLAEELAGTLGGKVSQAPHESLSTRELQVLRMVAHGRSLKEIAAELSLSEKTVGTYRSRISKKLGAGTNVELTRYAMRHGLAD